MIIDPTRINADFAGKKNCSRDRKTSENEVIALRIANGSYGSNGLLHFVWMNQDSKKGSTNSEDHLLDGLKCQFYWLWFGYEQIEWMHLKYYVLEDQINPGAWICA